MEQTNHNKLYSDLEVRVLLYKCPRSLALFHNDTYYTKWVYKKPLGHTVFYHWNNLLVFLNGTYILDGWHAWSTKFRGFFKLKDNIKWKCFFDVKESNKNVKSSVSLQSCASFSSQPSIKVSHSFHALSQFYSQMTSKISNLKEIVSGKFYRKFYSQESNDRFRK